MSLFRSILVAIKRPKRKTVRRQPSGRPALAQFFPIATLGLCLLLVGAYALLGGFSAYLPSSALASWSLGLSDFPVGLLSYLFVHLGPLHLAGNLLGLAVFCYLVERRLGPVDAVAIFVLSGVVAGSFFVLSSPSMRLLGASAGVAGLMAASLLCDPKRGFVALLALPLAYSFLLVPVVNYATGAFDSGLAVQQSAAQSAFESAAKNGSAEQVYSTRIAFEETTAQLVAYREAVAREASTESDFLAHLVGGVAASVYILVLRKEAVVRSIDELYGLRNQLF